jgi:DNA polymerase elongation subunit (family B)
MVYVHDTEVFPNFFSTVLWSIDGKIKKELYIYKDHNDINEIIETYSSDDWFVGYNSSDYDDLMIQKILTNGFRYREYTSDQITEELFIYSARLIDGKKDYLNMKINTFDLKRVANLYKSLKMVGVNLKHNKIQDLPKDFDEEVTDDEVRDILDYNHNDVAITYALYHNQRKEIQLRQQLTKKYSQNLMNYPDSGIANRILERDYEDFSGIPQRIFKDINTKRDSVDFGEIISDKITFQTSYLTEFLNNIKKTKAGKEDKIEFQVMLGKTKYDILKGGIHSNRSPEIFESNEEYIIKDADVTSYYINLMIKYDIKPEHLHNSFLPLLNSYLDTRVKAKQIDKHGVDAQSLKIVILSIFGKMGNEHHWLYDLKALYQTTLNGQLFLLMLIEALELEGISVHYANTDGLTAMVHEDKVDKYNEVCNWWQEYTGLNLEFEDFRKCINRDVNSYLWLPFQGEPKYKNVFDPERYKDVVKAYDKPIIPIAISEYFIHGIPVEETIRNHPDILDFCMAQKPGEKFDIFYDYIEMGYLITEQLQKTNRYYVGKKGGNIYKLDGQKRTSLVAGEAVHLCNDVTNRDARRYPIKYRYYINEANKLINLFNDNQIDMFL